MEQKTYSFSIITPEGLITLKINRVVINESKENMRTTLSTSIQGEFRSYQAETTEDALYCIAKDLPENWHIKSCLSCQYGHFCPIGNGDNELFCVTDFEPKSSRDLWRVTEDDNERKNRSRKLFHSCEFHKEQSKDYYTSSDYYFRMNDRKSE